MGRGGKEIEYDSSPRKGREKGKKVAVELGERIAWW